MSMFKVVKSSIVLLLVAIAGAACAQKPSPTSTGVVMFGGKPLRAVGVNYFDAVGRTLINPEDRSYISGLAYLERFKIPFVRVNFGGYWPNDFGLYLRNREAYFRIIEDFLDEAEKRGLGVVATVVWNYATIPDLVGEPVSAWGNRKSKTNAFMREYASELAKRFGARDSVWVWEFGNEMSMYVDLPNASELRPQVRPGSGTPASRSKDDEISTQEVNVALTEFRLAIRKHDARTILSSGQSLPRPYAYNNTMSKSWKADTREQFCNVLVRDNPDGYGLMSVHVYESSGKGYFGTANFDSSDISSEVAKCAARHNQAVFVGEFGFNRLKLSSHELEAKYKDMLGVIDRFGIQMAALWVFDYKYQSDSFSIDRFNGLSLMSTIEKFNRRRELN